MHPGADKNASLDEDEKKTCGNYMKCEEDSKKRRMYVFNNLEK